MIVWVTKTELPEEGRAADMTASVHRSKAEAVRVAKDLMRGDHASDTCVEVVKVTFPEGDKAGFIRVLKWAMEDHDTSGHLRNETPGTIQFKEIK